MKKFTLVALAMMASASCFAQTTQTTLWNGEDKNAAFWADRCNPQIVANPAKDATNGTDKCAHFKITGNEWNTGCIVLSLNKEVCGTDGLDVSKCKRLSIMIKKTTSSVVKVELSAGADTYWKHIAANYTGNGEWQKLVFDFSVHSAAFESKNPVELAIYPDNDGEDTNEDIYVDNIVLEANPTVNDESLWDVTEEGKLTGNLKLTGGYFKTTCMNTDVNPWEDCSIDDFTELNKKLSANVTSIDMRKASTLGVDIDKFFTNPNTIVYANENYKHANVVVGADGAGTAESLELTDANAFNAPYGFTATTVKLTRGVKKDVNSFVLPFKVKADELGATKVATYKDCEPGKVANFITDESVDANIPFLTMDVAEDKATGVLNFGEKTIVATPETLGTDFVGVYVPQNAEGKYGIDGNGLLHKGGAGATIAAFHAYLNVTGPAPAAVAFNGSTPTAINGVAADKVANTAVYDLSGRRVYGKLQKGLYIMNGKKVVVK